MSDNLKYWLERAKNVMDAESLVDAQAIIEIIQSSIFGIFCIKG
jgi:hypothetical protein